MNIKGKFKKRYGIAIVVAAVALIAVWKMLNAPLPNYQTLIVRKGALEQSVLATGKLDALRKVDVGAQVSGQLKTLSVNIGDKVVKDQLLGVIDPEQAENQIRESRRYADGTARAAQAGGSRVEAGERDLRSPAATGKNAGRFAPGSGYSRNQYGR